MMTAYYVVMLKKWRLQMPTRQKCNKCGEKKVLKDFPLGLKVHSVQRYKHICIACETIRTEKLFTSDTKVVKISNEVPTIDTQSQEDYTEGMKLCNKCGIEKPIEDFFKDRVSNGRQTYRSDCKLCSQFAAKGRIARYKDKKRHLVDTLTNEEWQNSIAFFDGHCAYCGTGLAECQEHVTPVDKGGSYAADNIVPACLKCNSSKGNRHLKFWWKQQSFFSDAALTKVEAWLQSRKLMENDDYFKKE